MKIFTRLFFKFPAALFFAAAALASGGIEPAALGDEKLRARYLELINKMRCVVCQNQTLAESDAPLAGDMRATIRAMLQDGATEAEVADFMTARYGDFVLYEPPFAARTLALWFGPLAALLAMLWLLPRAVRRRRVLLSEEQRAAAQKILRQ